MGRYMRKGKIGGEVAVMEVSHHSTLGVRTRARSLALQNLSPAPLPEPPSACYLQLRSRRLEKPSAAPPPATAPKPSSASLGSFDDEVSFGDNVLELDGWDRSVRETTPCSLIRDPETIRTPGSTTRTNSTASNRRMQASTRRNIPTSEEMEEFFAAAEQIQQRIFAEKYNFDPVNDCPIDGRYEWVKLDA